MILQDEAESVIAGIRARQSLGDLAPRGGPVVRRFFALRDRLPRRCVDPEDERVRALLDVTFHHHAMALATALEFCAMEWRSPEIARQVDAMDGLGQPARRLDEVYAALKTQLPVARRPTSSGSRRRSPPSGRWSGRTGTLHPVALARVGQQGRVLAGGLSSPVVNRDQPIGQESSSVPWCIRTGSVTRPR